MKYADVLRNKYFQVIASIIIAVNILLIFAVSQWWFTFSESSITNRIGILWKWARYDTIATIKSDDSKEQMWIKLAKIKQWDIEQYKLLSWEEIAFRPSWWSNIVKSSILMNNKDYVWAQKILDATRVTDQWLVSLVLALRWRQMCQQRLRDDCQILAENAISVDPVAPLWHYVVSWPMRVNKDYKWARDILTRASQLSWVENSWLYHNRWLIYFYTRDRELSAEDLQKVQSNLDVWFEAKIFLWRNALEKKNYEWALKRFTQARAEKGTWNVLPYLRLGRLAVAQENRWIAKILYNQWFELFPNNMEMITDYLTFAHKKSDKLTRVDMLSAMSFAVWSNPYNHEVAGRKLREIWEFELAKQYINRWLEYVKDTKDPVTQSKQTTWLYQQLFVSYAIDAFDIMKKWWSPDQIFEQMSGLSVQSQQLNFMKWLNLLLTWNVTWAQIYFDTLTWAVRSSDYPSMIWWFRLLSNDVKWAQEQLNIIPESEKLRILSMSWAISQTTKSRAKISQSILLEIQKTWIIKQLSDDKDDDIFDIRSYMQLPFRPWLQRIAPYADPLNTIIQKK